MNRPTGPVVWLLVATALSCSAIVASPPEPRPFPDSLPAPADGEHALRELDAEALVSLNGSGPAPMFVESPMKTVESAREGEKAGPPRDASGKQESQWTLPPVRRLTGLVNDSSPILLRLSASGLYVDNRRGGTRAEGRVRDMDFRLETQTPKRGIRVDLSSGVRWSQWNAAGASGSDINGAAKDLVFGLETRPLRVFDDSAAGNALLLKPRVSFSAPTGDASSRAPFAFSAGSGVWRPAIGGSAEFVWRSNYMLTLETMWTTSIDDHRGRRPGDRWESALWLSGRMDALSVHFGTTAAVQLSDRRTGGRTNVDVRELSFEIGLRPSIGLRLTDYLELFIEGRAPVARSGSGAGEGRGVQAGLLFGLP